MTTEALYRILEERSLLFNRMPPYINTAPDEVSKIKCELKTETMSENDLCIIT